MFFFFDLVNVFFIVLWFYVMNLREGRVVRLRGIDEFRMLDLKGLFRKG